LEALFRENLLDLTVLAAPHAITETENWLNQFSHLFNKSIITRIAIIIGLFQDAFFAPTKRFVHNVYKLWTTLSALAPPPLLLSAIKPFHLSSIPLNLRI